MKGKNTYIDFHSHILPRADHGSDSVAESQKQLSILDSCGAQKIVVTPHFYPDTHDIDSFVKDINASARELLAAAPLFSERIYVGTEVLLFPNLYRMEGLERLCIRGTNVILLELPPVHWNRELADTVIKIWDMGLVPLLAHIDRYLPQHRDELAALTDEGIPAQVNLANLASLFKRKNTSYFFEKGSVYALGSDIHGSDFSFSATITKGLSYVQDMLGQVTKKSEELLREAIPLSRLGL